MLINATAYNISILSTEGVDYNPGTKSHWSAPDLVTVTKQIPYSSFICEIEVFEVPQQLTHGIPTSKVKYGEITNLPEPQEGVFYIVDSLLFAVGKARGRTDLLTPYQPVFDGSEPEGGPYLLGYLGLEK